MIEIITGIAATVGGGAIWYYVQKALENRISVKPIKSSDDDYVGGLVDLYEHYFPNDGTNYTRDEVVEFMNARFEARRIVEAENITLAAVLKNEVVGFILCHFYPESRKAIVSYVAVKGGIATHQKTSRELIKKLKSILTNNNQCDFLFFEIQGFDSNKGLRRLFAGRANSIGLKVRKFVIEYQCPRISMSGDTHEAPFSLFCVGLREDIPDLISKQKMLGFLAFIYFECYGDLYPINDELFYRHREHLKGIIDNYEKTLPDLIPVVDAVR